MKKMGYGISLMLLSMNSFAATEVSWWHNMGGQRGEALNQIVVDFNESQSEYKVAPVFKGAETLTAGIAAFRANEAPNMMLINEVGSAMLINAPNVVKPFEELMTRNGYDFEIEGYLPGVRYMYADKEGQMIGFPFSVSTPVMYYNKDILDEVGVNVPRTFEQFEVVAETLKEEGYQALTQSMATWIMVESFVSSSNLPLANESNGYDGPSTEIYLASDEMVQHFTKLKEWSDKGYFGYYGSDWGANQTPFESGDVAMWLGSSSNYEGVRQTVDFELGATFLPYWQSITEEPYHTFTGGGAVFALNTGDDKQEKAVAAFLNYLTQPETQAKWHTTTGYVPATEAAYQLVKKSGYYDDNPGQEIGIQQFSLKSGEWSKGLRLGYYQQIRTVMDREFDKLFSGQSSVEQALNKAQQDSSVLLQRYKRTVQ